MHLNNDAFQTSIEFERESMHFKRRVMRFRRQLSWNLKRCIINVKRCDRNCKKRNVAITQICQTSHHVRDEYVLW